MSSKLLDAHTATQPVPWRIGVSVGSPEPLPFEFDGFESPPAQDVEPDVMRDPDRGQPPVPVVADHSACEARVVSLEREVRQLGVQLLEEKRVAYQQGFDAGVGQEASKWSEATARSAKAVADLAGYKARFRNEIEEDAVKLSLAIAKKVLRREVNVDPDAITGLLRVALERVSARDVLRIRASPQDVSGLSARLGDFCLPVQVEVVSDGGLERGGLLLDTAQGYVDASIDAQLMEIERGLTDALEQSKRC